MTKHQLNQPQAVGHRPDHYPSQQLAARIAAGDLQPDTAQAAVAQILDALVDDLSTASHRRLPAFLQNTFTQFFSKSLDSRTMGIKGLYIYGGVGRGKTMLMDMFHQAVKAEPIGKSGKPVIWRLHFHDFMVLAQDVIHAARTAGALDPIEAAATDLAARGMVVCFDEMEVRDIADAMILARLFSGMLERGTVVVATSNRHANGLYKNGLHRDRFLPFIALVKDRCRMYQLDDDTDWRSTVLADVQAWYSPLNAKNQTALEAAFARLAGDTIIKPETIRVAGRDITIERVAGDVGHVGFAQLCDVPLAARDYLAIAGRFAGLVISDVPRFTAEHEHVARRFMWLIDALYDRNRFLIASASAEIDALYDGDQWQFEFARTASRLGEMTQRGKS